jgi:hypothetical protein
VFRLVAKGLKAKSQIPWEREPHVDVTSIAANGFATHQHTALADWSVRVSHKVQDNGDGSYRLAFQPKSGINELSLYYRGEDEQPIPPGQWMLNVLKRAFKARLAGFQVDRIIVVLTR